jgi:DNA repair photolyase
VRWDNLTDEAQEQRSLPGYRDPAAVRRFDAPEALDMRFYEVHAKSVLNRVPEKSRMPFRWTINAYRGCTHACVYCVSPETGILLADGSTKPISELEVGEGICGTVREGNVRRLVGTAVLAKWSTSKPAYRVVLENGTELVASGDHRFLTGRGWRHVIGAERGEDQRPSLRIGDELVVPEGPAVQSESAAATAVAVRTRVGISSIEPLGKTMPLVDITTGTGDFIANGVVSHNCFARPTHTYLNFNAGRDFEREIVVKVNAPEVLRAELARPSWKHEHVAIGTNTDPYQWVEKRYRLMVGIWEALRDASNPCSVLTKSPLLLRDLDLMLEIAARTSFSACLSIPTLDEKAWRQTEPHTPHPKARLEAVAELNRAGIPTGVLVAPLMPGINDSPRQLEPLLEKAHEAGATSINGIALHLRGEVRQVFMEWMKEARPELVERYRTLYKKGPYAPTSERERLAGLVRRKGKSTAFRLSGHEAADAPPKTVEQELQPTLF